MNMLVCVKQVPDTTEIKIDPVKNTLIREGVPSIVNPFDGYALEAAARIKDADPSAKIVVLSMGPEQAKAALKECLAIAADKAYLVSDRAFGGSDTLATSYILSSAVKVLEARKGEKFDAIFCGKQAIDGDTGQVGPEMAEHLDYPQITYATELVSCEAGKVRIRKETADGYDVLETALPAVISVTKTPFELRFPTVKKRLAANRAQIVTITPQDMEGQIDLTRAGLKGSPTKVKKSFTTQHNKTCVLVEEDSLNASAVKLVALLSDAKKI